MNAEEMAIEHSTGWAPIVLANTNTLADAYRDIYAEKERSAREQVLPDFKRKRHNRKKGK